MYQYISVTYIQIVLISVICLRFTTVKIDVPAPRTKSGDLMVEFPEIEMIHRDLLNICVGLVNAPSQRGWVHWNYEAEFCTDGDGEFVCDHDDLPCTMPGEMNDETDLHPSVSELWTSEWWRETERATPSNNTQLSDVPNRILAIGIATDETAITLTGELPVTCYLHKLSYDPFCHHPFDLLIVCSFKNFTP